MASSLTETQINDALADFREWKMAKKYEEYCREKCLRFADEIIESSNN